MADEALPGGTVNDRTHVNIVAQRIPHRHRIHSRGQLVTQTVASVADAHQQGASHAALTGTAKGRVHNRVQRRVCRGRRRRTRPDSTASGMTSSTFLAPPAA